MNVEVIGRQYEVSPGLRRYLQSDIDKLQGILGANFKSKVILVAEKALRKAEITVSSPRKRPIVGLGSAKDDMRSAISQALDRIEKQALKHNGRCSCQRDVKAGWKRETEPDLEALAVAAPEPAKPVKKKAEAHLVRTQDAIATHPMTVEEAVKECEAQDREVLVFREKKGGAINIVHRTRVGKLELIELP